MQIIRQKNRRCPGTGGEAAPASPPSPLSVCAPWAAAPETVAVYSSEIRYRRAGRGCPGCARVTPCALHAVGQPSRSSIPRGSHSLGHNGQKYCRNQQTVDRSISLPNWEFVCVRMGGGKNDAVLAHGWCASPLLSWERPRGKGCLGRGEHPLADPRGSTAAVATWKHAAGVRQDWARSTVVLGEGREGAASRGRSTGSGSCGSIPGPRVPAGLGSRGSWGCPRRCSPRSTACHQSRFQLYASSHLCLITDA